MARMKKFVRSEYTLIAAVTSVYIYCCIKAIMASYGF